MLLTTSWSGPTLSSRVPSSRLMRHLFECGTRPMWVYFQSARSCLIINFHSTVCPTSDKEGRKGGGSSRREEGGRGEKVIKPCTAQPHRTEEGYVGFNLPRLVTGTWLTDARYLDAKIDTLLETQFGAGRLYAAISSRPGQVGRADGYILEGKELEVGFKYECQCFV